MIRDQTSAHKERGSGLGRLIASARAPPMGSALTLAQGAPALDRAPSLHGVPARRAITGSAPRRHRLVRCPRRVRLSHARPLFRQGRLTAPGPATGAGVRRRATERHASLAWSSTPKQRGVPRRTPTSRPRGRRTRPCPLRARGPRDGEPGTGHPRGAAELTAGGTPRSDRRLDQPVTRGSGSAARRVRCDSPASRRPGVSTRTCTGASGRRAAAGAGGSSPCRS